MGSTSVLERIELLEEFSPTLRCEVVWARAKDGAVSEECGNEAKYIAVLHANANSQVKPCVTTSKYLCQECLEKSAAAYCNRHNMGVLISYTNL
jgi:hypothetical protein